MREVRAVSFKAQVYCRKEPNKFARRGYIYCWYYRVINTETGNVMASDNTADWRRMIDAAMRDLEAIRHCASLGILKKARSW
jgi:hypothetical protein